MPTPPDSLPDDASALKALLVAAQAENERLIAIIKELQRYRFGPRSEKIDPGQLALMLEDVEQAIAASAAQAESQTEDQPAKKTPAPSLEGLGQTLRRRDAGAGARSGPTQNQDWPALGLRPRRPALGRSGAARRCLCLRARPQT